MKSNQIFKSVFLLLYILVLIHVIKANAQISANNSEKIYYSVDIPVQFKGGANLFNAYVRENMQYPDSDYYKGVQGKVIVKFIVRSNGSVDSLQILKGLSDQMNEEAKRLISTAKRWQPAFINNKPVSSYIVYPVLFNISDSINQKVQLNRVLMLLDNQIMPNGFDIALIDPVFIASGKYIKPYPKSVFDSLIAKYGNSAYSGVLEINTIRPDFINVNETDILMINNEKLNCSNDTLLKTNIEKYLSENLKYPVIAQELKMQGNANLFLILNENKKIEAMRFDKSGKVFFCNSVFKTIQSSEYIEKSTNSSKLNSFIKIPITFFIDINGRNSVAIGKNFLIDNDTEIKPRVYYNQTEITELFDLSMIKTDANDYEIKVENCTVNISPLVATSHIETTCYRKQKLKSEASKNDLANVYKDPNVYQVVEEMPLFVGGDSELSKYLGNNLRYPVICQENRISGTVITFFDILEDGSIDNIQVIRSPHQLLSEEAIRVISLMPKWIPGKQLGKTVKVRFTLPIHFKIS